MSAYPTLARKEMPAPAAGLELRLPAWIRSDGHGGAVVTIGEIAMPYANLERAQAQLEAMEQRGDVRIERGASC